MVIIDSTAQVGILTEVLDAWANGIREHQPERVASYFTEDALFQGFDKTQTIGRPGVVAYYDKQPVGLSPAFRILEHRQLSDEALIAYVDVDFTRPDGVVIPVHLTAVLELTEGSWLNSHYHVSKID
jgi:ketosteroid isomerase-like protein